MDMHRGCARPSSLLAGFSSALVLLLSCGEQKQCDGLELGRLFAGEGAVQCGDVEATDDRTPAVACAREALASGTPWYVRIHSVGTDSAIADTFAWSTSLAVQVHEDWFPCSDRTRPHCKATVSKRRCTILIDESSIFCDLQTTFEPACE